MSIHLVVVHAFADYKRGDLITDEATVKKVLADNARLVVRCQDHPGAPQVTAPEPVAPSTAPAQPAAA